MNANLESAADEPIETFVTSKVRTAVGILFCIIFWGLGFGISSRYLVNEGDGWVIIPMGILLSLGAGYTIRILLLQAGMRIVIHREAIGMFRRGQMKFIPWNEITSIRFDSGDYLTLNSKNESFVFCPDAFQRRTELQQAIYRQAMANGIPCTGSFRGKKHTKL